MLTTLIMTWANRSPKARRKIFEWTFQTLAAMTRDIESWTLMNYGYADLNGRQQRLRLEPRDEAAAIELGYAVGNLHWRVEFAGSHLRIALDGPEADYLDRLQSLLADGRIARVSDA